MKFKLSTAIIVSFLLHITIVWTFVLMGKIGSERAAGSNEYVVAIDIISSAPASLSEAMEENTDKTDESKMAVKTSQQTEQKKSAISSTSGNLGGSRQSLSSGNMGTNRILSQIRTKIERAKRYPRMAMKMRIEGRPSVAFQINPDGSVKYVRIVNSSGEEVLDKAALETVQRAAPLPYYESPINIAIRYELK